MAAADGTGTSPFFAAKLRAPEVPSHTVARPRRMALLMEATSQTHVQRAMPKLDAPNRTAATHHARQPGPIA